MRRYRDHAMSLADACLAELHDKPRVRTLDSDFRVYRRLGRLVIPTLMPNITSIKGERRGQLWNLALSGPKH